MKIPAVTFLLLVYTLLMPRGYPSTSTPKPKEARPEPRLSIAKEPFHLYGQNFPPGWSVFDAECWAFRTGRTTEQGGLGKYRHFKNLCKWMYPQMIWHPWAEDKYRALCDDEFAYKIGDMTVRNVSFLGCATSAKTFDADRFAFVWWMADMKNSIVILTSTTKEMIGTRMWPIIQDSFHEARKNLAEAFGIPTDKVFCGHLIDSKRTLQASKGDDKHVIKAYAVKDGKTSVARANIQGQHAPRMLVIMDEAPATPEAIFETLPNLLKSCQDMTILTMGNAESRLDNHGLINEPGDGWESVTQYSTQWRTKGVREWHLPPGVCLHFNGENSPNVKARRTLYPFIYTYESHLAVQDKKDTQHYWTFDAGFYVPDGMINTVMTITLIDKYQGRGTLYFNRDIINVGALDPAFGGDNCTLRFGRLGTLVDGKKALLCEDRVIIDTSVVSNHEREYQIAKRVIQECGIRNVSPEHFALDATGTGRGVAAVLIREWSPLVLCVEFGGAPSDKPASLEDSRASSEVYDRRVSELWWSCREFLMGGQLCGLNREDCIQFTTREYEIRSKKYRIDTKEETKQKIKRSPDDADTVALLVELCRSLGATARPQGRAANDAERSWLALARQSEFTDQQIPEGGVNLNESTEEALFEAV